MNGFASRPMRRLLGCALAAGLLAAPVASLAADDDLVVQAEGRQARSRTIEVSLAGLDLGSEAGQRALQDRIHSAAQRACGRNSINRLEEVADYVTCRDHAFVEARVEAERAMAAGSEKVVLVAGR